MTSRVINKSSNQSIVWLVLLMNVFLTICFFLIDSFLPAHFYELGANPHLIAFSVSGYYISKIVIGPFISKLEQRIGCFEIIVLSIFLNLLSSVSYLLFFNYYLLVIMRFLQGAVCALLKPVIFSIIKSKLSDFENSHFFYLFDLTFYFSMAISPFVGGLLISRYSFNVLFIILICIYCLIFVVSLGLKLSVKLYPYFDNSSNEYTKLHRSEYSLYAFIIGKAFMIACITVYFPLYLISGVKLSLFNVGIIVSCFSLGQAMVLFPAKKMTSYSLRSVMIVTGGVFSSLVLIVFSEVNSFYQALGMSFLIGACCALSQPAFALCLFRASGESVVSSKVIGRFGCMYSAGFVLGMFFISIIVDYFSFKSAFICVAFINIATTFLYATVTLYDLISGHQSLISE